MIYLYRTDNIYVITNPIGKGICRPVQLMNCSNIFEPDYMYLGQSTALPNRLFAFSYVDSVKEGALILIVLARLIYSDHNKV